MSNGVVGRVIADLLSMTEPLHKGKGSGGEAGFASDRKKVEGVVTDVEGPQMTESFEMSTDIMMSADQRERLMPEMSQSTNRGNPPGLPSFDTEGPWIAIESSSIRGETRSAKHGNAPSEPQGMDDWNRLSVGTDKPKADR
jgi:hypothetical protein